MRRMESAYFALVLLTGVVGLDAADGPGGRGRLPPALRQRLLKPVAELRVGNETRGESPADFSSDVFQPPQLAPDVRPDVASEFQWAAPNVTHKPAYFEDVPLERYGQTGSRTLQPVFSGARFFTNAAALPWKAATECPGDEVTTRGLYRPGSPTPCIRQRPLK